MSTVGAAPDLTFVSLIHQSLRADGPRLVSTVAALQPGDRESRLPEVRTMYGKYREQLIAHHTHEDRIFFPALAAKAGEDAMHLDELMTQHGQLDEVLDAIEKGFGELADPASDFEATRNNLTGELSTMVEHLTTHLDFEEKTALPMFASEMSPDEYTKLEAQARKATPREQASFMVPWLVEHASPEQQKALYRLAPPFRILNLLNRRRYRRLDGALLPAA